MKLELLVGEVEPSEPIKIVTALGGSIAFLNKCNHHWLEL